MGYIEAIRDLGYKPNQNEIIEGTWDTIVTSVEIPLKLGHTPYLDWLVVHRIVSSRQNLAVGINSGTHGGEDTSVKAARMVTIMAVDELAAGSVTSLTIASPRAVLMTGDRGVVYDWREPVDLNRNFGNESADKKVQDHTTTIIDIFRTAFELNSEALVSHEGKGLEYPFILLDLHTEDDNTNSNDVLPYIRIDPTTNDKLLGFMIYCAECFGIPWVMEYQEEEYEKEKLDGSLTAYMVRELEIPALTIELGPAGRVDPKFVQLALDMTNNFFKHFKMRARDQADFYGIWPEERNTLLGQVKQIGDGKVPLQMTATSGVDTTGKPINTYDTVNLTIKPGDFATKGQIIGYIDHIRRLGEEQTPVYAPYDSWVLSTVGSTVMRHDIDGFLYQSAIPVSDERITRIYQEQKKKLAEEQQQILE